jgi:hypothetical protein
MNKYIKREIGIATIKWLYLIISIEDEKIREEITKVYFNYLDFLTKGEQK